jgi:ERCC4-type nuclease
MLELPTSRQGPYSSWNETPIPADGAFVIVEDTREQQPLFDESLPFVCRKKLENGDYSLQGFEDRIFIELKRLSDFMSYIGSERQTKTIPKLSRLDGFFFRALCVVESESTLFSPVHAFTSLGPEHVRGFLKVLNVRYGVHFYCNPSEDMVRRWIFDRLIECYNHFRSMGGA